VRLKCDSRPPVSPLKTPRVRVLLSAAGGGGGTKCNGVIPRAGEALPRRELCPQAVCGAEEGEVFKKNRLQYLKVHRKTEATTCYFYSVFSKLLYTKIRPITYTDIDDYDDG